MKENNLPPERARARHTDETPSAVRYKRTHRLEQLIDRLPGRRLRKVIRWLRKPSSRWVRVIVGPLLIVGGFLSILPLFGLWMLPLGVILLSEDIPMLRRATDRILDWIERRHPRWLEARSSRSDSWDRGRREMPRRAGGRR